jgi:hypothetical protein
MLRSAFVIFVFRLSAIVLGTMHEYLDSPDNRYHTLATGDVFIHDQMEWPMIMGDVNAAEPSLADATEPSLAHAAEPSVAEKNSERSSLPSTGDATFHDEKRELQGLIHLITTEFKDLKKQVSLLNTGEVNGHGPIACIDSERNNLVLQEKLANLNATRNEHVSNHKSTVDALIRLLADETRGQRLCRDELKNAKDRYLDLHMEVEMLQQSVQHLHQQVTTSRINRTLIAQDMRDQLYCRLNNVKESLLDLLFLSIRTMGAVAREVESILLSIYEKLSQGRLMITSFTKLASTPTQHLMMTASSQLSHRFIENGPLAIMTAICVAAVAPIILLSIKRTIAAGLRRQ